MAQTKTQALNKVKATARYKKATSAGKKVLRQSAIRKWNARQPKNYTVADLAGRNHYPAALLETVPKLKEIFIDAYLHEWDDQKIQLAIENTDWFRDHSVRWKEVEKSRAQNPGEFDFKVNKAKINIRNQASRLGVELTEEELNSLGSAFVYDDGWSEAEASQYIGAHLKVKEGQGLLGEAGKREMELRKMANDYGMDYPDSFYRQAAQKFIQNGDTAVETQIRNDAANTYAQWGDDLRNGKTDVKTAAGSYLRALEKTYDLDNGAGTLSNPMVKRALQARDEQGNPTVKPLWQFEEDLRRDPKWLTTNNGAETMSKVAGGLLQEWGFLNNG